MEKLLLLKKADIIAQVIALFIPVLLCIFYRPFIIIFCYFSVGGVQVISCLVNKIFFNRDYKSGNRKVYEIALLIISILFAGLFTGMRASDDLVSFFLFFAAAMLLVGPVMAFCYAAISVTELHKIELDKIKKQGNTGHDI
jgi:hypothetical protein